MTVDWNKYPNFSKHEFDCKETGENEMHPKFLDKLQELRDIVGKPFVISSGYRSPSHSIEAGKSMPGEHTYGLAADISGDRLLLLEIISTAYILGFRRIGINLTDYYVHLGLGDRFEEFPSVPWDYNK